MTLRTTFERRTATPVHNHDCHALARFPAVSTSAPSLGLRTPSFSIAIAAPNTCADLRSENRELRELWTIRQSLEDCARALGAGQWTAVSLRCQWISHTRGRESMSNFTGWYARIKHAHFAAQPPQADTTSSWLGGGAGDGRVKQARLHHPSVDFDKSWAMFIVELKGVRPTGDSRGIFRRSPDGRKRRRRRRRAARKGDLQRHAQPCALSSPKRFTSPTP